MENDQKILPEDMPNNDGSKNIVIAINARDSLTSIEKQPTDIG